MLDEAWFFRRDKRRRSVGDLTHAEPSLPRIGMLTDDNTMTRSSVSCTVGATARVDRV